MGTAFIAWYLFLAGMGSGAFMAGSLVSVGLRISGGALLTRMRVVTDPGLVVGPLAVLLGAVFLLFDLGVPSVAWLALASGSRSILALGAWCITLFCFFSFLSLIVHNLYKSQLIRIFLFVIDILASLCALGVMLYSGIYLSIFPAVPFLHSPMVPVLFTLSALATGVALLITIAFFRQTEKGVLYGLKAFIKIDIVLVFLEIIALLVLLGTSVEHELTLTSVIKLIRGPFSALFLFGVCTVGLLLPLGSDITYLITRQLNIPVIGAGCTIIGGICLRYALLQAAIRYNLVSFLELPFWT